MNLRKALFKIVTYVVLLALVVIVLLPFYWMVTTSFKPPGEVNVVPPKWVPSEFHWQNYLKAWNAAPFNRYFVNSFFVSVMTTIGEVVTTIFAAYAFAKMDFFGKRVLFLSLLGLMMFPGQLRLIPNFMLASKIGWTDTYQILIIPWIASIFGIFLLRQYFKTIPDELWDAAQLDGCSRFRFLWKVVVPLSKPGIITVALFKFVGSWNAFLWVLIMTNQPGMRTIPVGLAVFRSEAGTHFAELMAASTMAVMPILIIFFFAQKQFIQGVARSGIK
ncbi:carbohydrate ABC transporter permease [Candidatus Bipolaricaulota bacterium]|nr:carbohydrate ABC transporter permease [Candidatus Bipolaricaulota bacterium]MCF7890259.1 carbohydrate ABC transporter permease [Candidatus Bipolaricaulota bacterium]